MDEINLPEELRALPQWLCWRWLPPREEGKKPIKMPCNPHNGSPADTTDPKTWGTFGQALDRCKAHPTTYAGLGFVFTAGLVGVDLDGCRDAVSGEIEPWAMKIVARLDSYTEISPSGKGLHILVPGTIKGKSRRKGKVEIYESGRYFTVTGNVLEGIAPQLSLGRQEELDWLYDETFGPSNVKNLPENVTSVTVRALEPPQLVDDKEIDALLMKMFTSKSGLAIKSLWDGDTSHHDGDDSAADLALMSHLAFWCNRNPHMMRALFSISALGQRSKWTNRPDYQNRTIEKALSGIVDGYVDRREGHGSDLKSLEDLVGVPIVPISSMTDLVDQEIEFLLSDLIPKGALVMLQGQPKGGKSVFALFIAMELAFGEWRAGLFEVKRPAKILLMEYEDAGILVAKRLSKYLRGVQRGPKEFPDNLLFCDFPEFYVDTEKYAEAMIEYIQREKIDLLILDTLSHIHRAENENQASDMKPAMSALKRITKRTGAAVLIIHHSAKGSGDRSISEKGRGSGLISAGPDVIIDWGDRKGTNTTPVSIASKLGDSFHFSVDYVPMTDGSVEWEITKDDGDWKEKIEKTYQEIKASVVAFPNGIPASELKKKLPKISDRQVDRYVNRLEKDGRVSVRLGKTENGKANFFSIIK